MKKVLLSSDKNFFKANMHCHTVFSDGTKTPEEIKKMYKEQGYSIVAFTDHEHIIDYSYLNDNDFMAITGCELAIKEMPKVSTFTKRDMKVCHLNFFALDANNTDTPCYSSIYDHYLKNCNDIEIKHSCGEYEREYSGVGISKMIEIGNKSGFLVSYNHPSWSLEDASDYLNYKGLWAVEVYNTGCVRSGLGDLDIDAYNSLLLHGNRLGCVAGDDNHNVFNDSFGGYIMINSEKLEYKSVMNALKNYEFYTSTGPIIDEMYAENEKIYIKVSNAKYIIKRSNTRFVDNQSAKQNDYNVFDIQEDDTFVRFEIFGDGRNVAYTNAYFIKEKA